MENYYTSVDYNEIDTNMRNIIEMNTAKNQEDDTEDYDLDYDPNSLYYELQAFESHL